MIHRGAPLLKSNSDMTLFDFLLIFDIIFLLHLRVSFAEGTCSWTKLSSYRAPHLDKQTDLCKGKQFSFLTFIPRENAQIIQTWTVLWKWPHQDEKKYWIKENETRPNVQVPSLWNPVLPWRRKKLNLCCWKVFTNASSYTVHVSVDSSGTKEASALTKQRHQKTSLTTKTIKQNSCMKIW